MKTRFWLSLIFLTLCAVVCLAPTVQMRTSSGTVGRVPYWTNGPFLSQTGPIVITNNNVGIGTATPAEVLHVAGNSYLEGTLVAPSSHHALGVGAVAQNIGLRITSNFTNDGGANTFLAGVDLDPTIVATALTPGQKSYLTYLNIAGFGITTAANETNGVVSSLRVTDPQITLGAGGSIPIAATVYIHSPPTEGVANASLYVNQGVSFFGGNVGITEQAPWEALSLGYNDKISLGASTLYNFNIYKINTGNLDTFFDSRDSDVNTAIRFRLRTGGTPVEALTIVGSGSVGIGTNLPQAQLHVTTTALIRTNIALLDVTTNLFVLNALNTNSNRRAWVSASVQLSAAAAGTAMVSLVVEHGTVITNRLTISAGPLASLITIEPLMLPLSPNAVFYFTNETSGVGGSAAIVGGTCSLIGF